MITELEIKSLAIQQGVPITYLEKDYVMGWILWGISQNPALARNLVLKGGNCLRKLYFADTRFSDDLDFTAYRLDTAQEFQRQLASVCKSVETASGIQFDFDRLMVEAKSTPDPNSKALDGRVYFRGFAGDSSVTMRVKFDVSEYEKIVLPLQRHPLIHQYSDSESCKSSILAYSLEEVLAEKLRSWIQRTRSRDLFDVVRIIQSQAVPISKTNIMSAFFQKTIFKNVAMAGKEELLYEPKFERIANDWSSTIICPSTYMIVAVNAISLFKDFVLALFDPELLRSMGVAASTTTNYGYAIRSGIREAIIEAGKARQLISMKYENIDRNIEPYSFRYKITQKGYGAEYFYGYDRTRGQALKSFFLFRVQGVSILPQNYLPRWVVEF